MVKVVKTPENKPKTKPRAGRSRSRSADKAKALLEEQKNALQQQLVDLKSQLSKSSIIGIALVVVVICAVAITTYQVSCLRSNVASVSSMMDSYEQDLRTLRDNMKNGVLYDQVAAAKAAVDDLKSVGTWQIRSLLASSVLAQEQGHTSAERQEEYVAAMDDGLLGDSRDLEIPYDGRGVVTTDTTDENSLLEKYMKSLEQLSAISATVTDVMEKLQHSDELVN